MNSSTTISAETAAAKHRQHPAVAILAAVSVAAVAGLLAAACFQQLPLMLLALVAGGAGLAMLRWPDLTILAVVGLIYSNLPVVAVQFHGAPSILPAAVMAMLAWPLLYHTWLRRENLWLLGSLPFLLLFALVQFLGAVLSRHPNDSIEHFVSFLLEGAVLYFAVTNLVRTRQMISRVLWTLALCAVVMGGFPLLHQVTGADSNFGGLAQADSQFGTGEDAVAGVTRQVRHAGTIGEQNRYAQFMILLAPIGICLMQEAKSPAQKGFAAAATALAVIGFALGFSRGAALGVAVACAAAAATGLIGRRGLQAIFVGSVALLLVLPQYLVRLGSVAEVFHAVTGGSVALQNAEGAVRGRLTEMGAAVLIFRDHPVLGVGPGMFGRFSQEYGQIVGLRSLESGRQAHSLLLDIAAEHGLLGLAAFGGMLAVLLGRLYRLRTSALARHDLQGVRYSTCMLLVLLLYLSTGLFLHLSYIRYFWLLIALADAVVFVVGQSYQAPVTAQDEPACPAP